MNILPKDLYIKNGTDVYKMVQFNQKQDRILEIFFEHSDSKFSIREISKKTKIPSSSVQRYLENLKKQGFINKKNQPIVTSYYKFLKTFFMVDKMHKSGLIRFLEDTFVPEAIILFGSIRKGEYDFESDIDLFILTSIKKQVDLKKFEKKLGHKIQLFIKKDLNELQPHLFNNVVNGIKLSGHFKIK